MESKKRKEEEAVNKLISKIDTSYKTIFPWDDVIKQIHEVSGPRYDGNKLRSCPKCNKNGEDLYWIKFKSSPASWRVLAGRMGSLSICPDCGIQVQFTSFIVS